MKRFRPYLKLKKIFRLFRLKKGDTAIFSSSVINEVKSKREKIDRTREQISELIDSIDSIVPQKLKISFNK